MVGTRSLDWANALPKLSNATAKKAIDFISWFPWRSARRATESILDQMGGECRVMRGLCTGQRMANTNPVSIIDAACSKTALDCAAQLNLLDEGGGESTTEPPQPDFSYCPLEHGVTAP